MGKYFERQKQYHRENDSRARGSSSNDRGQYYYLKENKNHKRMRIYY